MDVSKVYTHDIIIGKSFFKNDKIKNSDYFEHSILNLMIINNYNEKQNKNKMFKKELNNN